MTIQERFLSKVDRRGDDECWPWLAGKFAAGYGAFWMGGHNVPASRAAWELFVGPIPEGMNVCHRCDNRWCSNYIKCLFLGTDSDNMQDMLTKGRANKRRGEAHPFAKLLDWQVVEMRKRYQEVVVGLKEQLVAEFNVGYAAIEQVLDRTNWKGVTRGRTF